MSEKMCVMCFSIIADTDKWANLSVEREDGEKVNYICLSCYKKLTAPRITIFVEPDIEIALDHIKLDWNESAQYKIRILCDSETFESTTTHHDKEKANEAYQGVLSEIASWSKFHQPKQYDPALVDELMEEYQSNRHILANKTEIGIFIRRTDALIAKLRDTQNDCKPELPVLEFEIVPIWGSEVLRGGKGYSLTWVLPVILATPFKRSYMLVHHASYEQALEHANAIAASLNMTAKVVKK